ncbi:MAG: serpin family protein, partial [Polyangiaceae bacterium]
MMLRSSRLLLLSSFLIACGSSQPPTAQPMPDATATPPAPLGPTVPPSMSDAGSSSTTTPAVDPNAVPQFATEINAFNSDLYAKLKTGKGNLFYSPTSIEIALTMTAAGARGTTASQMQTVLHLPTDNAASANAGAAQLLSSWSTPTTSGPTLTIA